MSKPWTWDEDMFLASFFEAIGDANASRDLSRPKGSPTKRVAKLKESGAWNALTDHIEADYEHKRAYYAALGNSVAVDDLDEFHIGSPNWTWDDPANGKRRVS